jgi:pimeloyl-ACP methyl ester carboxylesterase
MGGSLAVLAALDHPRLVERLVLISPAGLPLRKPIRSSALTFLGQVLRGCYPASALGQMLISTAGAPLATLSLARLVHDLDLTPQLEQVRAHRIACTVIACRSDQLSTCRHCQQIAGMLAADYRELAVADGHVWMITQPDELKNELTRAIAFTPDR